jgi:carbamoyl-phosphate synthase large subunit
MEYLNCALVTAGNGDLAEAVCVTLKELYPNARIHGTELGDRWPAEISFDQVHTLPPANDDSYTNALAATAKQIGADIIIPCHDAELQRLAADPGPAAAFPLLMANPELVLAFGDKLATADWLCDHGIAGPKTVVLDQARWDGLPLIVKPRRGAGSRDIYLVRSAAHLDAFQNIYGTAFIAQTYLPDADNEFTCSVLRLGGQLRRLILRRRLDAGRTVAAQIVENPEIDMLLEAIALAGDLEGVLNVQLRLTSDGPMVFEINPRFSSTVRMRHLLGFSDLAWSIDYLCDIDLPQYKIRPGASVYRLSREILGE